MLQINISKRAAFIIVLAVLLVVPAVALAGSIFDDVDDTSTHIEGITFMKDSGVSVGCGTNIYCPSDNVSRAQMGTFMYRLSGNDPATDPSVNAAALEGYAAVDFVKIEDTGVVQEIDDTTNVLAGGVEAVAQVTLTAPADGYALVNGSAEVFLIHTNATITFGFAGVSASSTVFAEDENKDFIVPSAAATGSYGTNFSMTKVFPVTEGDNTFYLLGQQSSGGFQIGDIQLSALYVPGSLGTVELLSTNAEGASPESR